MIAKGKDRAAARPLDGLDEKALTVAGIYGPNGSGKTNLIDALAWLSHSMLGLIPELLAAFEKGGLIVVDELDASLHPVISGQLVELFQDPSTNRHGAQIIFTTNDTSLLGRLNRDEVWLTSKRHDGSTELAALSDYRSTSARRSTNLGSHHAGQAARDSAQHRQPRTSRRQPVLRRLSPSGSD